MMKFFFDDDCFAKTMLMISYAVMPLALLAYVVNCWIYGLYELGLGYPSLLIYLAVAARFLFNRAHGKEGSFFDVTVARGVNDGAGYFIERIVCVTAVLLLIAFVLLPTIKSLR